MEKTIPNIDSCNVCAHRGVCGIRHDLGNFTQKWWINLGRRHVEIENALEKALVRICQERCGEAQDE